MEKHFFNCSEGKRKCLMSALETVAMLSIFALSIALPLTGFTL